MDEALKKPMPAEIEGEGEDDVTGQQAAQQAESNRRLYAEYINISWLGYSIEIGSHTFNAAQLCDMFLFLKEHLEKKNGNDKSSIIGVG